MADLLIFTKLDLVDSESFQTLSDEIRRINATADIVQSIRGDIDYRKVFTKQSFESFPLTGQKVINLNSFATRSTSSLLNLTSSSCSHDHSIGAIVLGPYRDLSIDTHLLDRWLADILWDALELTPVSVGRYLFNVCLICNTEIPLGDLSA